MTIGHFTWVTYVLKIVGVVWAPWHHGFPHPW
jgi:hypothetical protein